MSKIDIPSQSKDTTSAQWAHEAQKLFLSSFGELTLPDDPNTPSIKSLFPDVGTDPSNSIPDSVDPAGQISAVKSLPKAAPDPKEFVGPWEEMQKQKGMPMPKEGVGAESLKERLPFELPDLSEETFGLSPEKVGKSLTQQGLDRIFDWYKGASNTERVLKIGAGIIVVGIAAYAIKKAIDGVVKHGSSIVEKLTGYRNTTVEGIVKIGLGALVIKLLYDAATSEDVLGSFAKGGLKGVGVLLLSKIIDGSIDLKSLGKSQIEKLQKKIPGFPGTEKIEELIGQRGDAVKTAKKAVKDVEDELKAQGKDLPGKVHDKIFGRRPSRSSSGQETEETGGVLDQERSLPPLVPGPMPRRNSTPKEVATSIPDSEGGDDGFIDLGTDQKIEDVKDSAGNTAKDFVIKTQENFEDVELSDTTLKRINAFVENPSGETFQEMTEKLVEEGGELIWQEGKLVIGMLGGFVFDIQKFVLFQWWHSLGRTIDAEKQDAETKVGSFMVHHFKEAPKFMILFVATNQIKNFFMKAHMKQSRLIMGGLMDGALWGVKVPMKMWEAGKLVSPVFKIGKKVIKGADSFRAFSGGMIEFMRGDSPLGRLDPETGKLVLPEDPDWGKAKPDAPLDPEKPIAEDTKGTTKAKAASTEVAEEVISEADEAKPKAPAMKEVAKEAFDETQDTVSKKFLPEIQKALEDMKIDNTKIASVMEELQKPHWVKAMAGFSEIVGHAAMPAFVAYMAYDMKFGDTAHDPQDTVATHIGFITAFKLGAEGLKRGGSAKSKLLFGLAGAATPLLAAYGVQVDSAEDWINERIAGDYSKAFWNAGEDMLGVGEFYLANRMFFQGALGKALGSKVDMALRPVLSGLLKVKVAQKIRNIFVKKGVEKLATRAGIILATKGASATAVNVVPIAGQVASIGLWLWTAWDVGKLGLMLKKAHTVEGLMASQAEKPVRQSKDALRLDEVGHRSLEDSYNTFKVGTPYADLSFDELPLDIQQNYILKNYQELPDCQIIITREDGSQETSQWTNGTVRYVQIIADGETTELTEDDLNTEAETTDPPPFSMSDIPYEDLEAQASNGGEAIIEDYFKVQISSFREKTEWSKLNPEVVDCKKIVVKRTGNSFDSISMEREGDSWKLVSDETGHEFGESFTFHSGLAYAGMLLHSIGFLNDEVHTNKEKSWKSEDGSMNPFYEDKKEIRYSKDDALNKRIYGRDWTDFYVNNLQLRRETLVSGLNQYFKLHAEKLDLIGDV